MSCRCHLTPFTFYSPFTLKENARQDLYKDKDGNIVVKPKGGNGPGEPTGLNINDF